MKADATNQEWNKVERKKIEKKERSVRGHANKTATYFHNDKYSECYSVKWIWALNFASDFICMRLNSPLGSFFAIR